MCLVNSSLTAKNDDFSQNMKETSLIVVIGSSDFACFVGYNYIKAVCTYSVVNNGFLAIDMQTKKERKKKWVTDFVSKVKHVA